MLLFLPLTNGAALQTLQEGPRGGTQLSQCSSEPPLSEPQDEPSLDSYHQCLFPAMLPKIASSLLSHSVQLIHHPLCSKRESFLKCKCSHRFDLLKIFEEISIRKKIKHQLFSTYTKPLTISPWALARFFLWLYFRSFLPGKLFVCFEYEPPVTSSGSYPCMSCPTSSLISSQLQWRKGLPCLMKHWPRLYYCTMATISLFAYMALSSSHF